MRKLLKTLSTLMLLAIVVLPPVLIALCLERYPLVRSSESSVFEDVKSAREALGRFDPRDMDPGRITRVSVTTSELNAGFQAANLGFRRLNARADISGSRLILSGTADLPIPDNPLGKYLNVSVMIPSSTNGLEFSSVTIGKLGIPSFLVKPTAIFVVDLVSGEEIGRILYESIRSVEISSPRISLALQPPSQEVIESMTSAAKRVAKVGDSEAIRLYYQAIVGQAERNGGQIVSLATYVPPVFALARIRSSSHDPVAENRAAILALALYFGHYRLEEIIRDVKTGSLKDASADIDLVKLEGRSDWVQHFTTSAGLMVAGGASVADVIGQAKEVLDSDGPSGFSFTDIAADYAGIRFAEVATASEKSARRVQQALYRNAGEEDFFPRVSDFPEGLSAEAFKARYGDVDSAAYQRVVEEINDRIDRIPLYKSDE